ncbi:MAG TPA: transporter substrate-binding domain-containing protein [Dongiaceae bacterium]|nr:transporter substrate-binding domain-containing protein [Dongiaceae bacterium]
MGQAIFALLLAAQVIAAAARADDQQVPGSDLPATELTASEKAAVDKLVLPVPKPSFGDFDAMKAHRMVRILVVNSRTLYFLDKGRELGIDKEFATAFDQELNKKYKTKALKIRVVLIPVPRDKLLSALNEGLGDIAAGAQTITPERQQLVDFSAPIASGVKELVVTGPAAPELKSIDDLAGKSILLRKSSSYYTHLLAISDQLKARNLAPIDLQPADEDLEDEDLLEMTEAGLLPFVVVDRYKGLFWSQVYKKLKVREDLLVNQGGDIAWAIRKNSPLLKAEIDDFMKSHKVGTSFGNTVVLRYLKRSKELHNASSEAEMAKFEKLIGFFRKYADQYKFNDLMMVAQGYQESQLDQSRRSPRGAVGVMQLLPTTAADPLIGINGIDRDAEKNILAGVKYMAVLRDKYLSDPAIGDKSKVLMTFAAYNAGPGNLNKFRRLAEKSGLDPNIWFNNVEIAASRIVGQETVQYVSNIYKYYVAYELVREREARKAAAKAGAATTNATPISAAPVSSAPTSAGTETTP